MPYELLPNNLYTSAANSDSSLFLVPLRLFSVTFLTKRSRPFEAHSQWFHAPLWFSNRAQDTISTMERTKRFFGLKGRQPAFVGRAWFSIFKTTATFLQTSPTTLWAPRCLPWQSQTVCPAAEICKTFRRSLAFAPNAQQTPCHRACRTLHCVWVQRVGVVAKNFSTQLLALEFV